jgi:hypothetical protein
VTLDHIDPMCFLSLVHILLACFNIVTSASYL